MSLFVAERQAGKLRKQILIIFGLTRLGIEPESTLSNTSTSGRNYIKNRPPIQG